MLRFIGRRALAAVAQTAGITILVFFLMRWLPADPAAQLVGTNATPESLAQARATLGLDQPVLHQLGDFLGITANGGAPGLLEGSLGR